MAVRTRCQYGGWGGCLSEANGRPTLLRFNLCDAHYATLQNSVVREIQNNAALQQRVREALRLIDHPAVSARPKRAVQAASLIYFVGRDSFIKIGLTTNLDRRLRELGRGANMPIGMKNVPIRLLGTMPGNKRTEEELHSRFAAYRLDGTEWFRRVDTIMQLISGLSDG